MWSLVILLNSWLGFSYPPWEKYSVWLFILNCTRTQLPLPNDCYEITTLTMAKRYHFFLATLARCCKWSNVAHTTSQNAQQTTGVEWYQNKSKSHCQAKERRKHNNQQTSTACYLHLFVLVVVLPFLLISLLFFLFLLVLGGCYGCWWLSKVQSMYAFL